MNTVQNGSRNRLERLGIVPSVSQRLKRMPAITAKLERLPTRLTQMGDIGGVRVIVEEQAAADAFVADLVDNPGPALAVAGVDDHVRQPRPDGYRGVHVQLRYRQHTGGRDEFAGLRVELQVRTRLQHAWATLVETLGRIDQVDYKSGGGGPDQRRWLLLGSASLAYLEEAPGPESLPPTQWEIAREFEVLEARTKTLDRLRQAGPRTSAAPHGGVQGSLFVLEASDEASGDWTVTPERDANALEDFERREEADFGNIRLPVLVGGADWDSITRSFASYRADAQEFIEAMTEYLVQEAPGTAYRMALGEDPGPEPA
jgi:putative GTP pyrophosphokinase